MYLVPLWATGNSLLLCVQNAAYLLLGPFLRTLLTSWRLCRKLSFRHDSTHCKRLTLRLTATLTVLNFDFQCITDVLLLVKTAVAMAIILTDNTQMCCKHGALLRYFSPHSYRNCSKMLTF